MEAAGSNAIHDTVIDVDGARIGVRRISGKVSQADTGPVIVLLHEALGCIDMWKDVPDRLAAMTGCPVLVFDRFGHGRSDAMRGPRDAGYLHAEAFEVLPQVLERSGVSNPVLIGHSDGGTIALLYASRFPARAVVTEAAHVLVEDMTRTGIRAAVDAWHSSDLPVRLGRYHGEKTGALFTAWSETWLSEEFEAWNIEASLSSVTAPCLVIQGHDDEYGTVRQVDAIARGVSGPVRTLLVPSCGHIPHLQAKNHVLAEISEFVRESATAL